MIVSGAWPVAQWVLVVGDVAPAEIGPEAYVASAALDDDGGDGFWEVEVERPEFVPRHWAWGERGSGAT